MPEIAFDGRLRHLLHAAGGCALGAAHIDRGLTSPAVGAQMKIAAMPDKNLRP